MKIDTGMAISAITVGRIVPKKKNSTAATNIEAPISFPCKVEIEASMKLACLKVTRGVSIPSGKLLPMETRASSILLVKAMVSALGCFCTPKITAGLPSNPASPRLTAAAKSTLATCLSSTGTPSFEPTATFPRSSKEDVLPRFRIRYSRPLSAKNPPDVLDAKPLKACCRSSIVMPKSTIRCKSG